VLKRRNFFVPVPPQNLPQEKAELTKPYPPDKDEYDLDGLEPEEDIFLGEEDLEEEEFWGIAGLQAFGIDPKLPLLTRQEEYDLFTELEEDPDGAWPQVKQELVRRNLRLVLNIARRYAGSNDKLELYDLFQNGVMGLMTAIDHFDISLGNKLSTVATWWIRQAITRSIMDSNNTIRMPVHVYEKTTKLIKLQAALCQELGREPSAKELAEKMGIMRNENVTPEQIIRLQDFIATKTTLSLDAPLDAANPDSDKWIDVIQKDEVESTEDIAINELERKMTLQVVNEILGNSKDKRKLRIIMLRFGLDGGRAQTLEDIGPEFGLTKERIRQLQNEALNELRKDPRTRKLKDFIK